MENITNIATTLINGNISEFKQDVKRLSKRGFINLIFEYSLLSGYNLENTLKYFHKIL